MQKYVDSELGEIQITRNARAKNVIARRGNGIVKLTVPARLEDKDILHAIDQLRPKLLMAPSPPALIINDNTRLDTFSFRVVIQRYVLPEIIKMQLKNRLLTIFIPQQTEIASANIQYTIKTLIERALRFEAERILPGKTAYFAAKHNLKFNEVKINKSRSRWGSCSRAKSINFSLYLLLLPEKLIDYVVLHELAHTVEMNHSERFWRLLDSLCGEDSKELGHQARNFRSAEYDLLRE